MLGDIECPVGHLDGPPVSPVKMHARASWLWRATSAGIVAEVGELDDCRFEQGDGLGGSAGGQVSPSERGDRPGRRRAVLALPIELGRAEEECLRLVMAGCQRGDLAGPLEEIGRLGRVGRDRERLAQEGDRLVVRAEARSPARRPPRGRSGPGRRGRRLPAPRTRSRGRPGSDRPDRRRSRRCRGSRRSAPRPDGGPCDRASRACCRRPRGSAPGRRRTGRARGCAGPPRASGAPAGRAPRRRDSSSASSIPDTADSPARVKLWPRTAASEISARSSAGEPVEPDRDQRGQGLRDGECRQVADRAVDAVLDGRAGPRRRASGRSRPRTAGSRRRARRSPSRAVAGKSGHEPGQELAHRPVRQWLEVERGEVALAGTPVRAACSSRSGRARVTT